MGKYDNLTDQEFDAILEGLVDSLSARELLAIPGVYEILKEEFNAEFVIANVLEV